MTEPFFLRLVEENTSNFFTLSDCGTVVLGCNYFTRMPEIDNDISEAAIGHGGEVTRVRYRNVIETCELHLSNTPDSMLGTAGTLVQYFNVAHDRQRRQQGNRVFIEHRPQGRGDTNDTVRSELLHGRIQFEDEPLSPSMSGKAWTIIITWLRRYYWESLTVLEAELANESTSYALTSGGVVVKNHYDTGVDHGSGVVDDDNWVYTELAAGLIPSPAIWELTSDGNSDDIATVYISQNLYSTPPVLPLPLNYSLVLEAEDADSVSPTANTSNSNGNYVALSWTGTAESELIVWTLSSALLGNFEYAWFLPILRAHTTFPANTQIKARIKIGALPIHDTRWTQMDQNVNLQELVDPVRLSPRLMAEPYEAIKIALVAKNSEAGTHNLDLDFMQLSPTDSFRILRKTGGNWNVNETMVDNPYDFDNPYILNAGQSLFNAVALGRPMHIDPDLGQVFHFLFRSETGAANITRELTVKLKYRARSLLPYVS